MRIKLMMGAVLLLASQHSFGQVSPAGYERSVPLKVGLGFSDFNTDWTGRIAGPTLWMDWNLNRVPPIMNGLGIEIEGRDLNYARTGGLSRLRFDTAAAGPVYSFGHHRRIRPYGAFLLGLGSLDFNAIKTRYSHDTRTIFAPSGGVDCLIASRMRLRAGYEYQFWPDLFNHHALNPSGFTIGTAYEFGRSQPRIY